MKETPDSHPLDAGLVRYLRILVTALAAAMVAGILVIAAVIVIRFPTAAPPSLPESVALPAGTSATAFTVGDGWIAVVTSDGHILIYGAEGGAPRQTIRVDIP